MKWLKERLKERSTWRGLAMLGMIAGVNIDPAQMELILSGGAALVGVVETLAKEPQAAQ